MKLLILNVMIKSDWITVVFLLILASLGLAKYIYKERLVELLLIFFTKRYFLHYGKEKRLILNRFNAILFSVQTMILSLFVFLFIQFYQPELLNENSFLFYLKTTGCVSAFFLFRFLLGYFLATLFEINQQHKRVAFAKMSYLFTFSTLLLPFLLLIFYIERYNLLFFQLLTLMMSILLIVRYVFVLKNNKNVVFGGLFYFIVYLCALEIAPLLLIFKIVN